MLSFLLPLILFSTILATPLAERKDVIGQYAILNKCPKTITLYHDSDNPLTIQSGGNLLIPHDYSISVFHTDANGGWPTSPGTLWLHLYPEKYLYFMVVEDATRANTGLQVKPLGNFTTTQGLCETIRCDGGTSPCPQTFPEFPMRNIPQSASRQKSPTTPFYQCPFPSVDYEITFCPTGKFPEKPGKPIRFNNSPNKCLDVKGGVFANGTPVGIYDCNGTPAQSWVVEYEFGIGRAVKIAGTDFCLDADPANGIELKIWQCYDDLPAQQWYPTDDNHLELAQQGLCVDLEAGNTTNDHMAQTWKCTDNNENQVWMQ